MNFLCENCKQKYHVADEKLRGREVTKFKCKKCEHIIEVRGDAVGQGDDGDAAALAPSIPPPTGHTKPTAALPKPAAASLPTAATAAPRPAKPTAGLPVAGATKPAGTGFPTAGATKPAATLPTSSPRPATATAPAAKPTGAGLPTAGAAARAVAPASPTATKPAPVRAVEAAPAPKTAAPSALRSSITAAGTTGAQDPAGPRRTSSSASTSALLNSSETGWYAGIREVPVGPLTRAELATKIDSGEIASETLVWREGLDDWRPLSAVTELSDLLREASKRVSDTMLGAQSKRPPSNVVPLSRANNQKDLDEPEESTRLTSLSDLIATAEGGPAPKKPTPKPEPEHKPEHKPAPVAEAKPKPEPRPAPKVEAKPEPKPEPKFEATPEPKPEPKLESTDIDDEFFSGAKKPAAVAAAVALTPPPAAPPAKPAFSLGDVPPATAAPIASVTGSALPSIPPPAEAKESKKGGVPIGVVVVLGGLVVLAGGGGLYMGTRINQQPAAQQPPVTQPAQQPTAPTPPNPQVSPGINVHEPAGDPPSTPTPPTNPPATPANTPPQPAANNGSHAPSGSHASGGSHSRPSQATSTGTTTGLTAEQIRQMQAQLGTAPSGVGTASAGGPVGAARTANTGLSGSGSEAPAGPTGGVRATQVLEVLRRTNVVGSCWQTQITRNPAHPAERITVSLTVNTTGRATNVSVNGSNDPALATCIQNRARSQNYGPGGTIDAQASFNLAIGS